MFWSSFKEASKICNETGMLDNLLINPRLHTQENVLDTSSPTFYLTF